MDSQEEYVFLNFTNHPSSFWSSEQQAAALRYGPIQDLAFPQVNPGAPLSEIQQLQEIISKKPDCVLCQGEFTLSYQIIALLKQADIPVVAACAERNSQEIISDGTSKKVTIFRFVQFREYQQPECLSMESLI